MQFNLEINSYNDGLGKIPWLSNGAHIDLTPAGEVILKGQNLDTRRQPTGMESI